MKKIVLVGCIGMMLAFAACGGNGGEGTPTNTPTVSPTTAPTQTPELTPSETPEPTSMPVTETPVPTPEEVVVILGAYEGMTLTDVTQKDVDDYLKESLQSFAEYVPVDRAAQNGDVTNINYVGKLDGVAFAGGTDDSEEGTDLELGSGSFIPGFEEGLIGAVAGEVRDLELTFPEEYHNADMAGKTVIFTVTVNAVYEIVCPELTDEFVAEQLGMDQTAEEVRQSVYEELRWNSLTEQVLANLMNTCDLETYPEEKVYEEAAAVIDMHMMYAEYYAAMYGATAEDMLPIFGFESLEALQEYALSYAAYTVKMTLVLNEIAKEAEIVLTEEIYNERALEYAVGSGFNDLASFEEAYAAEEIEEAILFDLVLEYIISKADIVGEN